MGHSSKAKTIKLFPTYSRKQTRKSFWKVPFSCSSDLKTNMHLDPLLSFKRHSKMFQLCLLIKLARKVQKMRIGRALIIAVCQKELKGNK